MTSISPAFDEIAVCRIGPASALQLFVFEVSVQFSTGDRTAWLLVARLKLPGLRLRVSFSESAN